MIPWGGDGQDSAKEQCRLYSKNGGGLEGGGGRLEESSEAGGGPPIGGDCLKGKGKITGRVRLLQGRNSREKGCSMYWNEGSLWGGHKKTSRLISRKKAG